jgi:hypothetical protein
VEPGPVQLSSATPNPFWIIRLLGNPPLKVKKKNLPVAVVTE